MFGSLGDTVRGDKVLIRDNRIGDECSKFFYFFSGSWVRRELNFYLFASLRRNEEIWL